MGGAPPPPPDCAPQGPKNGNFGPPEGVRKGHLRGPRITVQRGGGGATIHCPSRAIGTPQRGVRMGVSGNPLTPIRSVTLGTTLQMVKRHWFGNDGHRCQSNDDNQLLV